ncbi:MAG: PilT/PilU family type 4a pilus ATPase [Desulfobacterales bacterium]|nr:PilT/PilU family type 4a pilus ATPase [Desulfobacterales bacterium]
MDEEEYILPIEDKKSSKKEFIGEMLIRYGIINEKQLTESLKYQTQNEGHIGSILLDKGYISLDDLLFFLENHLGKPAFDLNQINIDPKALRMISIDKIKKYKALPIAVTDKNITVAMLDPYDFDTIKELEFTLGKVINPVIVPSFQMDKAIAQLISDEAGNILSDHKGNIFIKSDKGQVSSVQETRDGKRPSLILLLKKAKEEKASDLLLTAGAPPSLKIDNELKRLNLDVLTPGDCESYVRQMMTQEDWDKFANKNDYDFAFSFAELGRFRINAYRQRNSISIAIRPIWDKIPSLDFLNIPDWIHDFALKPKGLICISGSSGHGKSTTMAAMLDIINTNRKCNIITLEDPIEYMHRHKKCNINQREIGKDANSFAEGLRYVLRQAPDVICVGEIRDGETCDIVLRASQTGHLVISTIHANNATSIIERLLNMFPPHQQETAKMMIANSLLLCINQCLIPKKNEKGRILAFEKLVNSNRIKSMIRTQKTHQIRSQITLGADDFQPMEMTLAKLYNSGQISMEEGEIYAEDEQLFKKLLQMPEKPKKESKIEHKSEDKIEIEDIEDDDDDDLDF